MYISHGLSGASQVQVQGTCVYVLPNCMLLAIVATFRIAMKSSLWHAVVCHIYVGIGPPKMVATLKCTNDMSVLDYLKA